MTLTNLDAFEIPLICHDIGFSVGALAMLDCLGELQEPLAAPVEKYQTYYRHWGPGVGQQILDVEGRLNKYGLASPPRWKNVGEYAEWSLAIVKAVRENTSSDAGSSALVILGHNLGLLLRSTALYFLILRLAEAAPQNEAVRYRQGRRREDFLRFVNEFVAAANQANLPAAVRPLAEKLWLAARPQHPPTKQPASRKSTRTLPHPRRACCARSNSDVRSRA
jgi:hypothetical protein